MSSGQQQGSGLTGQKKWILLIPLIGLALIVVTVAVIVSMADPLKAEGGDKGPRPRRERPASLDVLYDGTRPGAADPDLKELSGGLKYRDLLEGDGAEVPEGATVVCDYTGWLLDGQIFDSSWRRPEPTEFSLNGVIQGWTRGIPKMKVGGIRKLVIPPSLGYPNGTPDGSVPPGATLVFEVQVLEIKDERASKSGRGRPPGHP